MAEAPITLRSVIGDRSAWVPLLLEADESEPVLRSYLHDGELYELMVGGEAVGAALLISVEPAGLEIKNIVLSRSHRGRGLGRAAILAIAGHARGQGAERLLVGTADSSLGTIAFYGACGFREAGRFDGFFDAYPAPVIEDGVQAHDMVRFVMDL